MQPSVSASLPVVGGVCPPAPVVGKPMRVKPACKGPSTDIWRLRPHEASLGETGEKPIKIITQDEHEPKRERGSFFRNGRLVRPADRLPLHVDEELTAYLQCEFAFRPRVPELMAQMANKARQFLGRFDTSELSWVRRRDIVIRAVGAAMDVTQAEFEVRQHLRDPTMADERSKQHKLLTSGKVTSGSFFFPGKSLPVASK